MFSFTIREFLEKADSLGFFKRKEHPSECFRCCGKKTDEQCRGEELYPCAFCGIEKPSAELFNSTVQNGPDDFDNELACDNCYHRRLAPPDLKVDA